MLQREIWARDIFLQRFTWRKDFLYAVLKLCVFYQNAYCNGNPRNSATTRSNYEIIIRHLTQPELEIQYDSAVCWFAPKFASKLEISGCLPCRDNWTLQARSPSSKKFTTFEWEDNLGEYLRWSSSTIFEGYLQDCVQGGLRGRPVHGVR